MRRLQRNQRSFANGFVSPPLCAMALIVGDYLQDVRSTVSVNITAILADMLDGNRGPDPLNPEARIRPNYGVRAVLDGELLTVELTFQANAAYCCMQSGCHLALHEGNRWNPLREIFGRHDVPVPQRFELQLTCVIEEGAAFFDLAKPDPDRRGWYRFKQASAYQFQTTVYEGYRIMLPTSGWSDGVKNS